MDKFDDPAKAKQILQKYLSGDCSPEEEALVLRWYYSFSDDDLIEADKNAEQSALQHAKANVLKSIAAKRKKRPSFFYLPIVRAAAILLVVVTAGLIAVLHFSSDRQAPIIYTEFKTAMGERRQITLPDGSTLTLNAGSTVKIPSDFAMERRVIELTGEAFFDVVHNVKKPFLVKTSKLITRDIGTSFDIKAYPDDKNTMVAVLSGRVGIDVKTANGSKLLVSAINEDQMLEYDQRNSRHDIKHVNASHIAAWKTNELYFDAVTISDMARVLERNYNIKILVKGSEHNSCLYTAKFTNEPIGKVLNIVADLSGSTWEITKNQITINVKNCRQ
jgi:transmembrane sensor